MGDPGELTVRVRLFASLRRFQPKDVDGAIAVQLPADAQVKDVVAALGIPPDRTGIVVCGDVHLEPNTPLRDGMEVSLFPPLAGGGAAAVPDEAARLRPIPAGSAST